MCADWGIDSMARFSSTQRRRERSGSAENARTPLLVGQASACQSERSSEASLTPQTFFSPQRRRDAEESAEKTGNQIVIVFSALISASLRLCGESTSLGQAML